MRRLSVASALVGALSLALYAVPLALVSRLVNGAVETGFPAVLPTFGTVGQTTMAYLYVTRVLSALGLVVPGTAFGYLLATRRDVRARFRGVVRAVTAGETAGAVGAAVLFALLFRSPPVAATAVGASLPATVALALVGVFVQVALVVVLATLAGTALGAWWSDAGRSAGGDVGRSPSRDD